MRLRPVLLPAALAFAALGARVAAQIEGAGRGVAPLDSTADFEVGGIRVDVAAKDANTARYGGWRVAQRKAWAELSRRVGSGRGTLPDGTLDSIVSGIVVEHEEIGPTRYVARLGVLFDRDRAGAILGIAAQAARSQPMVVVPVMWSGGVATAFEQRTPWQEAWARYRVANSAIDYVRPVGTGADPLLLDYGQTQRPGRGWWRVVLDQYGGSDVVIPTVRLQRQWPGGPIVATFEARHGPDNKVAGSVTLRVAGPAGLPRLLDAGVRRLDDIYQAALRDGRLGLDPGLSYRPDTTDAAVADPTLDAAVATTAGVSLSIQFDTPDVAAVNATEAAMRAIPGVSAAGTGSLALGGLSVMSVTFSGPPDALRAALQTRGWQVFGTGATWRIRRAPQLLPPGVGADDPSGG